MYKLFETVRGGQIDLVCGTYVPRELAPVIARWCSVEFSIKVNKIINAFIDIQNKNTVLTEEDLRNLTMDNKEEVVTVTNETKKTSSVKKAVITENLILMHNPETNEYAVFYRRHDNQVNNRVKSFIAKNGDIWYHLKTFQTHVDNGPLYDKFSCYVLQNNELKKHFDLKRKGFRTNLSTERVISIFEQNDNAMKIQESK